jgi:DNA polymerase-1
MTTVSGTTAALPPRLQAVAKKLAEHWTEHGRHKTAKHLAGGLFRAGWPLNRVNAFVQFTAETAGDEELENRLDVVQSTHERFQAGEPFTSWKDLIRLKGDEVVRQLQADLGIHTAITLADLAEYKALPVEFLQSQGLHDLPGGGVGIPHMDAGGKTVEAKRRTAIRATDGSRWPKGKPVMAYGEHRLADAVAAGYLVLVEGETDCLTLWYHGHPALGLPGAETTKKLEAGHVGNVGRIYVFQEPDKGGEAFVAGVRARLAELGWEGEARVVRLDRFKDPSELHIAHPDHEDFRERFQQALDQAAPLEALAATAVCLTDVEPKVVKWLWDKVLPLGTITLLDGDPGLGKSLITLEIAARLSRGLRMPPGSGPGDLPPGNTLILNAEDDLARTIKPSLMALDADMSHIFALPAIAEGALSRPAVLPDDLDLIERLVNRLKIELVIIDPLMAFLTGKVDSHKDSDIRRVLHRVKLLAERTQAVVLIVRRLNKLINVPEPLYRGGGSIGIIGAARSALLVGKHPDDPENRILCRSKGNLSVEPKALVYTIESFDGPARVFWHGEVDLNAEDLLGRKPQRQAKGEALDEAVAFLEDALRGGRRKCDEVQAEAAAKKITEATLRRAKTELEVRAVKEGFNPADWFWELPGGSSTDDGGEPPAEPGQDPGHANNLSAFGENGQISREIPETAQVEISERLREFEQDRAPLERLREMASAEGAQTLAEGAQITEGAQIERLEQDRANPTKTRDSAEGAQIESLSGPLKQVRPGTAFQQVRDTTRLSAVLAWLAECELVALDTETTGLDPHKDRVRLLSLSNGRDTWVLDCFAVSPRPLFPVLSSKTLIAHNALFDLGMLAQLGFLPGSVVCTMLLSQLLHGTRKPKGFHTLAGCVERELAQTLDKDMQRSDWSRQLSQEQLRYAAADVQILTSLYESLDSKIRDAGLFEVAAIERRALPAIDWLAGAGVPFDRKSWTDLAEEAKAEADWLAGELDAAAPARPGHLSRAGAWQWDSLQQVKEALAAVGCEVESTDDEVLAKLEHPLATLLRRYRAASKRLTTYGLDWLKHAVSDGRVYAGWRQIGADSGRMSCREPNLQNMPRDPRYRRCFRAPDGRLLVKGDYSQIELRIAAKLIGDKAMLDAYKSGADLHTLTAQRVLCISEVTKQHRQLAKALNFGLLYGMGARSFREYAKSNYSLDLTERQAWNYRQSFFVAYPNLAAWHTKVRREHAAETRTLIGRRRQFGVKTPDTERLNTPVQGSGADGLKLALALLWERRAEVPGAFPVLAAHDEIVIEADVSQADAAAAWVKQAMLDAMTPMLDPVPVEVEVTIAPTWGG